MKYIKRPAIIEAEQYVEYGKLVKGMCNSQSCFVSGNNEPHVHTIHKNQIVILEIGDYIIPEPDGEHFYPCKPDIFKNTYSVVNTNKVNNLVSIREQFLAIPSQNGLHADRYNTDDQYKLHLWDDAGNSYDMATEIIRNSDIHIAKFA